jgi:hypothetical protein
VSPSKANPARAGDAAGSGALVSTDTDTLAPKLAPSQEEIAASITCRWIRQRELREATAILLDELQVKLITARHFSRQCLDSDADAILREAYRLMAVDLATVRRELQRLGEVAQ